MKDGIGTERTIGKLPRNGGGKKERDLTRQMVACKFAKENYCGSRYFYEDLGRVARKGDKVSIAKSGKSLAMLKRQLEKKAYEYLTNIPKLLRTVLFHVPAPC